MKTYLDEILDHYYSPDGPEFDQKTVEQVGKTLLDYLGIAVYTAKHANAEKLVKLIVDYGAPGPVEVFGTGEVTNAASAAMANACRVSNIEMDDGSGINAAVHPGVYVWSAAIAQYRISPCSRDVLIRAIVFGYDLCMRAGMLATNNVYKYDLHGPGMNGAFGAVAAAGMIAGLNREQMQNAIGFSAALLPISPFVSFINGTDNKDLYGGWGTYLAMFSVDAAKRGLTGPKEVLDDVKSLQKFFDDSRGKDVPFGSPYYINLIGFKEFPSCLMAHPSLTALGKILAENSFDIADIESIEDHVHPGAFVLNSGVRLPLTPTSARLYLPYCIAVYLKDGMLHPDAFTDEAVNRTEYLRLGELVHVIEEPKYSPQNNGMPSCTMIIRLKDGRQIEKETIGVRWCVEKATKEELIQKYRMLTDHIQSMTEQDEWIQKVFSLDTVFIANIGRMLCHPAV